MKNYPSIFYAGFALLVCANAALAVTYYDNFSTSSYQSDSEVIAMTNSRSGLSGPVRETYQAGSDDAEGDSNYLTLAANGASGQQSTATITYRIDADDSVNGYAGDFYVRTYMACRSLYGGTSTITVEYSFDNSQWTSLTALSSPSVNDAFAVDTSVYSFDAEGETAVYVRYTLWSSYYNTWAQLHSVLMGDAIIPAYSPNARDLFGANGTAVASWKVDTGLEHGRETFSWNDIEPADGQWDFDGTLGGKDYEQILLDAKSAGMTIVPMLGYTALWATDAAVSPAGVSNDFFWRAEDLSDWEDFVDQAVAHFSAAPYKQQYWQIWNEPTDEAGFWSDTNENFIDMIYNRAADIIHSHYVDLNNNGVEDAGEECKVIFGGWPASNTTGGEYNSILSYNNAGQRTDIIDWHYLDYSWSTDDGAGSVFQNWVANGICEGAWITEHGNNTDIYYVSNRYFSQIGWALNHNWDDPNKYRILHWHYNAPQQWGLFWSGVKKPMGYSMETMMDLLGDHRLSIFPSSEISLSVGEVHKRSAYWVGEDILFLLSGYAGSDDHCDVSVELPAGAGVYEVSRVTALYGIETPVDYSVTGSTLSFAVPLNLAEDLYPDYNYIRIKCAEGSWPMDEGTGSSIADATLNQNSGTISGATWAVGKSGSCLEFDGSGDSVNLGDADGFDVLGPKAIECWLYPHDVTSEKYAIGKRYNAYHAYAGYLIYVKNGNLYAGYSDGSDSTLLSTACSANEWMHVVFNITPDDKLELYVNGILVDSETDSDVGPSNLTYPLRLGRANAPTNYWDGLIDEVRIYSKNLTLAEVSAQYVKGHTVGSWAMDEGSGTTLEDATANQNDGTIYGATWGSGGHSLVFDGSNDYVVFSDQDSLGADRYDVDGPMAIECWLNPHNVTNEKYALGKRYNGYYAYPGYLIYVKNGNLYASYSDGMDNETVSTVCAADEWIHVVFNIYPNDRLELYVDGVLVDTQTNSGMDPTNTSIPLRLGRANASSNYFDGEIERFRIYDKALTEKEVIEMYLH